jgi:hypothetical protein
MQSGVSGAGAMFQAVTDVIANGRVRAIAKV